MFSRNVQCRHLFQCDYPCTPTFDCVILVIISHFSIKSQTTFSYNHQKTTLVSKKKLPPRAEANNRPQCSSPQLSDSGPVQRAAFVVNRMNKVKCLLIPEDSTETLSLIHHCGSLHCHLMKAGNYRTRHTHTHTARLRHTRNFKVYRYSRVFAKQFSFVDSLLRSGLSGN